MKRRLFTILSALSLVLCVAACAAWVRSSVVPDRLGWIKIGPEGDGDVERHGLFFGHQRGARPSGGRQDRHSQHGWTAYPLTFFHGSQNIVFTYPYMDGGLAANRLGFRFFDKKSTNLFYGPSSAYDVERDVGVIFPYWFMGAIFGILPVMWMVRTIRQPHRVGVCRKCGYDLRATPDRCPECGTETKTPGAMAGR